MLPEVGSTIVPPGVQQPLALGLVDHGDRGAVLDAAARVEQLDLGDQVALEIRADPAQPDHRRVADQVEQRVRRPASPELGVLSGGGMPDLGHDRERYCGPTLPTMQVHEF